MIEQQDGQYAYDRPWQLTSEALAQQRTWWNAGPPWILPVPRTGDPHDSIPPRFGYRTMELTITDVLNGTMSRLESTHARDSMMTDFSGQQGSYEGTLRPTGAGGSGIT